MSDTAFQRVALFLSSLPTFSCLKNRLHAPKPFISFRTPKFSPTQTRTLIAMAQREKEETEVQITETLTLCVNNCGFYGNPATKNMCQSCFQAQIRPAPSSSVQEKRRSDPTRLAEPEEKRRDGKGEDRTAAEVTVPLARKVNRCSGCGKRVGLTGFRCRCGELFCGEHRYSDRHECSFDYKAAAREAIQRENPVVRAAKIVRV